jgi:molybdopterin-guanine dinucleotide biosynthesis protein A
MGRDKASLPFGKETMLQRVTRLVAMVADGVIIVGRRDQQASTVHDGIEDQGPLVGLAAGLAASKTELNLVVACDMPLIKPAVLQRLIDAREEFDDACVAVVDGHVSPLCGFYRKRAVIDNKIRELLAHGDRSVMGLLDIIKTKRVDAAAFRDIDPNLETFISVDTPEKYADAIKRLEP